MSNKSAQLTRKKFASFQSQYAHIPSKIAYITCFAVKYHKGVKFLLRFFLSHKIPAGKKKWYLKKCEKLWVVDRQLVNISISSKAKKIKRRKDERYGWVISHPIFCIINLIFSSLNKRTLPNAYLSINHQL